MYVSYAAEFGNRVCRGEDASVFEQIGDSKYYRKRLYIYPSESEEKVWLWSVGFEKATPEKANCNRVLQSRCIVHYCTKGKGYFNGLPITAGMAFVAWSDTLHSITADPEDPFEFYWIMIRGKDVSSFIREFSFKSDNIIFDCDYMEEVIPLIECMLNADYSKIDLPQYSSAMMKAILSFQISKYKRSNNPNFVRQNSNFVDYIDSAKNILYDNNYAVSVDEISDMLGITPQHLIRVFRKVLGESPKQYITRKRMALARELLEKGIAPTEVANILKYMDYPSFYRAFIKEFKISPSEYLKK